jgi:hypothetical protein
MRFCRRCVNSAPWRHCPAALAPRDGKGATWQRAPRGSGNRTCLLQCHFRLRTIVYQDRLGTNILQAGKTQTRDAFLQSDRRAAEAWGFCVSKHCALTATSTIVPVRTTTLLNVLLLAFYCWRLYGNKKWADFTEKTRSGQPLEPGSLELSFGVSVCACLLGKMCVKYSGYPAVAVGIGAPGGDA